MNATVNRLEFLNAITMAALAQNPPTSLPILETVLIRSGADKQRLIITGTDLDNAVTAECSATVTEEFGCCIHAKTTRRLLEKMDGDEVVLDIGAPLNKATLADPSGTFTATLSSFPADEFPNLKTEESIREEGGRKVVIQATEFNEALAAVAPAMSKDETRYVLCGMLFESEDGRLTIVATDGRRIHRQRTTAEAPKGIASILPERAVRVAMELFGEENDFFGYTWTSAELWLSRTDYRLTLLAPHTQVVQQGRTIDGTYPNYRQVIPAKQASVHTISVAALAGAAQRALALPSKTPSIRMEFSKGYVTASTEGDGQKTSEWIAETPTGNPEGKIAINPKYLAQGLAGIKSDLVKIGRDGEHDVITLNEDGAHPRFMAAIMPMRFN